MLGEAVGVITTTRAHLPKRMAFEHFAHGLKEDWNFMHFLVYDPWKNVSLARNVGAMVARSFGAEVLVFLDDDAVFSPEFLVRMVALVKERRPVNMPCTLCFAIRGEDFALTGGFDLRHKPMFQEDIELFIRCERAGMRILQLPTPDDHIHYAATAQRPIKVLKNEFKSTKTWMQHRVTRHTEHETISPPLGSPRRFLIYLFQFLVCPKRARYLFVHIPAFFYWLAYMAIHRESDWLDANAWNLNPPYAFVEVCARGRRQVMQISSEMLKTMSMGMKK